MTERAIETCSCSASIDVTSRHSGTLSIQLQEWREQHRHELGPVEVTPAPEVVDHGSGMTTSYPVPVGGASGEPFEDRRRFGYEGAK